VARTPTLTSVRSDFAWILESSENLASAVLECAEEGWDNIQGWELLFPAQARRVIALSFMTAVGAWEEFVQGCFVRYMAGAVSPSGYAPHLRIGACETLAHAGQVLTRRSNFDFERSFLSWAVWSDVIDRAKIYFRSGRPFSDVDAASKQRLQDASVIRNRVAHSSEKCRADFVAVAKHHLGLKPQHKLKQGYDVGRLLIAAPAIGFQPAPEINTYFAAYFSLFRRLADVLAPP
jgi:hypothetical protein